jgi:hypothetical protein
VLRLIKGFGHGCNLMTQYSTKTLDLAIKTNKNKVALWRILLFCVGLYAEVQDIRQTTTEYYLFKIYNLEVC